MKYQVVVVPESQTYGDTRVVFFIEDESPERACYQAAVKLANMMPRDFFPSHLESCVECHEKTV